jgi:hypothetical protein
MLQHRDYNLVFRIQKKINTCQSNQGCQNFTIFRKFQGIPGREYLSPG